MVEMIIEKRQEASGIGVGLVSTLDLCLLCPRHGFKNIKQFEKNIILI